MTVQVYFTGHCQAVEGSGSDVAEVAERCCSAWRRLLIPQIFLIHSVCPVVSGVSPIIVQQHWDTHRGSRHEPDLDIAELKLRRLVVEKHFERLLDLKTRATAGTRSNVELKSSSSLAFVHLIHALHPRTSFAHP